MAVTDDPALVTGENLGTPFPTSLSSLRAGGAGWLTEAFRATGCLDPSNRVTEVTSFEEFIGGGAGRKACITVAYEREETVLHPQLFVKLPRDFGDPLRPLFSHLMQPEAQFALLSRRSDFPVPVPTCYFADYDPVSSTGLIITERIRYGEDGVEPFRDKCVDYSLPEPGAHYRALTRALGRLTAGHQTGRLGDHIDERFPFTAGEIRSDDLMPYSEQELRSKLEAIRAFSRDYPGLVPEHLGAPEFLDQFVHEAPLFLEQETAIKRYLNSNPDFIALCHWNANVDNAWFRRLDDGELEAGLIDWGSVGQMNVAQCIFGMLCATETDIWDAHAHELIALFADEYAARGGPRLDLGELTLHVRLFTALLGLAWLIDAPALVRAQIPDLRRRRPGLVPPGGGL